MTNLLPRTSARCRVAATPLASSRAERYARAVATCIRCRRDPCRCPTAPGRAADSESATGPTRETEDTELAALADLARLARIRTEASSLSPAYVVWLESGCAGPEPLVPTHVRKRIRELMDEADRLSR